MKAKWFELVDDGGEVGVGSAEMANCRVELPGGGEGTRKEKKGRWGLARRGGGVGGELAELLRASEGFVTVYDRDGVGGDGGNGGDGGG